MSYDKKSYHTSYTCIYFIWRHQRLCVKEEWSEFAKVEIHQVKVQGNWRPNACKIRNMRSVLCIPNASPWKSARTVKWSACIQWNFIDMFRYSSLCQIQKQYVHLRVALTLTGWNMIRQLDNMGNIVLSLMDQDNSDIYVIAVSYPSSNQRFMYQNQRNVLETCPTVLPQSEASE